MSGSWCAENLRDAKAWSDENLRLTVSSDEAAKLYDGILRQLVSWINCEALGGLEHSVSRMLETEPDFVMGRTLVLGMSAMGSKTSIRNDHNFRQKITDLVKDSARCTPREQIHTKALQFYAKGNMISACIEWEKILREHPTDLMALKFAHDAYFFLGDPYGKRDNVARVIEKWDKKMPCYSYLHGMYAFGLEESGEYNEAEKHARIALEMHPQECWATHALAHCLEMKSALDEGIRFMESTVKDWAPCQLLTTHNYWHLALFYIEKGDYETVLSILDNDIVERAKSSNSMLELVDTASLLTRLELEGVDVGKERWAALERRVKPHVNDHVLAFNDAHISMVISRLEDPTLMKQHSESIREFVNDEANELNWHNHNLIMTREIGEFVCDAIVHYNSGRFHEAFDALYQIRSELYRISGSHAQRDVFIQILIHAGLKSEDALRRERALEVINERNKLKPNSPLADRLIETHKKSSEH